MKRLDPRLRLALLVLPVIFLSHCNGNDAPPPLPKAAREHARPGCCDLVSVTGLKEGAGRLVVAYPGSAAPKESRTAVLQDGKEVRSGYGSQSWDLAPGAYDVTICNKPVPGVAVLSGRETRIKVGVLHLNAGPGTRIELLDPASGAILIGGYGERSYGLPIGPVSVRIAGQSETAMIEAEKVTEF